MASNQSTAQNLKWRGNTTAYSVVTSARGTKSGLDTGRKVCVSREGAKNDVAIQQFGSGVERIYSGASTGIRDLSIVGLARF